MKVIYKITYPNGKIYVGQDVTDSINYFGSCRQPSHCHGLHAGARRAFTVRREILWESEDAPQAEVDAREAEFIHALRANDPSVGYNKWPRLK